jgi:hypothetical protein
MSEPAQAQAPQFHVSLIAGGLAGTTVDVALFPLDTLKTRLQSPQGFFKAGGFRGVYQGMQSVAFGYVIDCMRRLAVMHFLTFPIILQLCTGVSIILHHI